MTALPSPLAHLICFFLNHDWNDQPSAYYMVDREHELIAATTECARCGRKRISLRTLAAMEIAAK